MKYGNYRCGVRYTFDTDAKNFITQMKRQLGKDYDHCKYGYACFSQLNFEEGNFYLALPYEKKYEEFFPIIINFFENVHIEIEGKFYFEDTEKVIDEYGSKQKEVSVVVDSNEVYVIWKITTSEEYTQYAKGMIYRIIGCLLRFFSSGEYYVESKKPEGDFIQWLCTLNNLDFSGHSIGNYKISPELLKKIDDIELVNKVITEQAFKRSYQRNQTFFAQLSSEK